MLQVQLISPYVDRPTVRQTAPVTHLRRQYNKDVTLNFDLCLPKARKDELNLSYQSFIKRLTTTVNVGVLYSLIHS